MNTLLLVCLFLSLLPALVFRVNLWAYRPPPAAPSGNAPAVSVLIPARNEEALIGDAVRSVLANPGDEFEVLVLDDHSEDATAEVVRAIADRDPRARLIPAPELPPGWSGKSHACWILAHESRHPLLIFLDADVRLAPDALSRIALFMEQSRADLASGIPHQVTVGFLEKLLIPLIHLIMLGFMPIPSMRRTQMPSLSAGCGQLLVMRRDAYSHAGGHAAVRSTWHDGIKLPRCFRAAGLKTDLFDATDQAECRLYESARAVWHGLSKNAGEALAAPGLIVPMSIILLGGQVVPFLLVPLAIAGWPAPWAPSQITMMLVAVAAAWWPRFAAARRFRQPVLSAALHPLGVLLLLAIQWWAFLLRLIGRPEAWKGRVHPGS